MTIGMEQFLEPAYRYRATVRRVYDGDTVFLDIDHGRRVWSLNVGCRLYGINAPELTGEERPKGIDSAVFLRNMVYDYSLDEVTDEQRPTLMITTHKDSRGKYGRDIVTLWGKSPTGIPINLNEEMLKFGQAEEYIV